MIPTFGLTHVGLMVRDPEVSLRFYEALFGVREYFRDERSIQVLGPGAQDVIAFERAESASGRGAIDHIGFRLKDPADIAIALSEVRAIGATIVSQGEFGPGSPYLNILDPDGNQIEIWFE